MNNYKRVSNKLYKPLLSTNGCYGCIAEPDIFDLCINLQPCTKFIYHKVSIREILNQL